MKRLMTEGTERVKERFRFPMDGTERLKRTERSGTEKKPVQSCERLKVSTKGFVFLFSKVFVSLQLSLTLNDAE